MFSSDSNEWETPLSLFNLLEEEFPFSFDVAATDENHLCDCYWTLREDALSKSWRGTGHQFFWCNPPYGRAIGKFVKKAYEESGDGLKVVCLIPARTDTAWWHDYCAKAEIRYIRGRLKFINRTLSSCRLDGTDKTASAPFPSAVVIFGNPPQTKYWTLPF